MGNDFFTTQLNEIVPWTPKAPSYRVAVSDLVNGEDLVDWCTTDTSVEHYTLEDAIEEEKEELAERIRCLQLDLDTARLELAELNETEDVENTDMPMDELF